MSNYILAVGIDNYQNCSKLNNAVRDINGIVDVLIKKYDFEVENVVTLLNEEATLKNFIDELESFLIQQNSGDNLIIIFSGHGEYDEALGLGYILPFEALPNSKSTYFPYSTLFNYIKALKSHHILLISDSCFSGSAFSPLRSINLSKEKLDKIPSRWAITSGRIETVSDGIPGSNSPFAESLIRILNEDEDELISISELSNRIISEVASKVEQLPRGEPLQSFGHKGGEFIFRKNTKKGDPKNVDIFKTEDNEKAELTNIINSLYDALQAIETAENEKKTGTLRRLNEEKESIKNILSNELLRVLEYNRNIIYTNRPLKDAIPLSYIEKHKELLDARREKLKWVKNQDFEKAGKSRELELQIGNQLNGIISHNSLFEKLNFTSESIFNDYFLIQFIIDTLPKGNYLNINEIEKYFIDLLYLDLSFESGLINKYVYKDKRTKVVEDLESLIKNWL